MSPSEINRANAVHSTGPKTEEGKQISSLNALRHGLTARQVVVPSEQRTAYRLHVKSFEDHLQPQGPVEANLVQSLADTAWRLNRVAALESKILRSLESLEDQIKALSNMSLYSQRLTRQFEKIEKQLRDLQDLRRQAEAKQQKPKESQEMASFFQTLDSPAPDAPLRAAAAAPSGPWPPAPTTPPPAPLSA